MIATSNTGSGWSASASRGLRLSTPLVATFALVVYLCSFRGSFLPMSVPVGLSFVAIILTVALIGVGPAAVKSQLSTRFWAIAIFQIGFVLVYTIGLFLRADTAALEVYAQVVLMMTFVTFVAMVRWDDQLVRSAALVALIFIVTAALHFAASGFKVRFVHYFNTKNGFAVFAACSSFFLFARSTISSRRARKYWLAGALVAVMLALVSVSRASMLLLLGAFGTYLLWPVISKRRSVHLVYLLLVFALVAGAIYLIAYLPVLVDVQAYNDLALQYTGGRLGSGRDLIWGSLLNLVGERPVLGYGPGAVPSEHINTLLSAHNLYIQITLQVGVTGLALFVLVLTSMWSALRHGRKVPLVRLAASYFVGIIMHQCFEVGLTTNNLPMGIIMWTIIGIGVNRSVYQDVP